MAPIRKAAPRRQIFLLGRVALGLAVSAGLGWLAMSGLDWSQVGDAFKELSIFMVLLALLVFLASNILRAHRWQILFINERISVLRLFVVQNEGIGLNNLVPLRVVSEATQWAVLTLKDGIKGSTALATLGMERVIDVLASTTLLVTAFVSMPEMRNFTKYIVGISGFAVVSIIVVRFLSWGSHGFFLFQKIPPLAAFASAIATLESSRSRLGYALFLTLLYWLMIGFSAWIVAVGMGVPISLAVATATVLGTLFFATAVPAGPGAIGAFEASIVYILGFFDVGRELALSYALIIHALLFVPPSLIALIFLPREGIGALRRLRTHADRSDGLADKAGS